MRGQEADRRRPRDARDDEVVGRLLAECLAQCDLDEVDAEGVEGQIGHLPAGDPRGDLDDERPAVVGDDQLRERDPVPQAQRAHGPQRDALRLLERVAEEPGGIGVDPADPEPDAVGAQAVGEQQRIRLPAARDHQPVQLEAVGEFLEDRLAGRRFRQRRVEVTLEVGERAQQEEAALASRVGRLQHGRKADRVGGCSGLAPDTDRRELRLRHPALGEAAAHRHLVRHQVRGLAADPGQAELLRDRRDDGHGAVGRDGQRPVDAVPPGDVDHRVDVDEVDHLRRVGLGQSGRLGFRSTATTRRPSSFARRIARRWWRPAPTKRTVFMSRAMLQPRPHD